MIPFHPPQLLALTSPNIEANSRTDWRKKSRCSWVPQPASGWERECQRVNAGGKSTASEWEQLMSTEHLLGPRHTLTPSHKPQGVCCCSHQHRSHFTAGDTESQREVTLPKVHSIGEARIRTQQCEFRAHVLAHVGTTLDLSSLPTSSLETFP